MRNYKNVLFTPDWRYENPYQYLLAKSIEKIGYNIQFSEYPVGSFALSKLALRYKTIGIIHLHWIAPLIEPIFWSKVRWKWVLRFIIFKLDLIFCRMLKIKIVWTVHNLISHESAKPSRELLCREQLAKSAHAIIAHSYGAEEKIREKYKIRVGSPVDVVRHASYAGHYAESIDRTQEIVAELGNKNKMFTFMFIGALRKYKGIEDLIEAFRHLPSDQCRLIIAGRPLPDTFGKELIDLAEMNPRIVLRLGYIPDADLVSLLNLADIVVLPFAQTLTSGSTLLAMSYGKPLILPEAARVLDLPGDRGAFYYDPAMSSQALSDVLRRAIAEDVEEMGRYNATVAAGLTWPRMASETVEIYRRVTEQGLVSK